MVNTANRLNLFSEYVFAKIAREVVKVEKETGRKVLSFGIGSPDVPTSEIYLDKLEEYLHESKMHLYPGFRACKEFSDALINWYQKRFEVELNADELLPLLGAKEGISHLPLALLNEGDEILVPNPGYPAYTDPALMVGARVVYYDLSNDKNLPIDLKSIEKLISPKTKCMWVNFPSNPTGKVITLTGLEDLVTFARKHKLLVLYDNAYSEITFSSEKAPSILQVKGAKGIAIEIGSFSKTYSFAGFRMGWCVGNKQIIDGLAKVKSQMDSGMWLPLQKLGAYALTQTDLIWQKQMLESYQQRRDIIAEKLSKLGLTFDMPQGALYIWAKIPDEFKNSEEYSMHILHEKNILLTPGTAFGSNGERYVRVSYCVSINQIDKYF